MARPNILLVVMDSVRARNCSAYGHRYETTPFLDELATTATRYDQARSPGIHSIASHASIFTGLPVERHGLQDHADQLPAGHTIWEELAERHGYRTGFFSPNPVITEASNLDEYFGTVSGPRFADPRATPGTPGSESADVYVDDLLDWIDRDDRPWAACLNAMDAHYPYEPRDEHDRWGSDRLRALHDEVEYMAGEFHRGRRPWWQLEAFERLYDGAIRQIDAELRRLCRALDDRGALDDALVVVTSDHGEGFGERSRVSPAVRVVDHTVGVHEVLLHVPLLVKWPGQTDSAVVDEPATVQRFPAVVRDAVDDRDGAGFVPDGPVVASTKRISDPGETYLADVASPESFEGPWRAAYVVLDGTVYKYAERGGDAAAVAVPDAQAAYEVSRDPLRGLSNVWAEDRPALGEDGDELDAAVRDRLADLGYRESRGDV